MLEIRFADAVFSSSGAVKSHAYHIPCKALSLPGIRLPTQIPIYRLVSTPAPIHKLLMSHCLPDSSQGYSTDTTTTCHQYLAHHRVLAVSASFDSRWKR